MFCSPDMCCLGARMPAGARLLLDDQHSYAAQTQFERSRKADGTCSNYDDLSGVRGGRNLVALLAGLDRNDTGDS